MLNQDLYCTSVNARQVEYEIEHGSLPMADLLGLLWVRVANGKIQSLHLKAGAFRMLQVPGLCRKFDHRRLHRPWLLFCISTSQRYTSLLNLGLMG